MDFKNWVHDNVENILYVAFYSTILFIIPIAGAALCYVLFPLWLLAIPTGAVPVAVFVGIGLFIFDVMAMFILWDYEEWKQQKERMKNEQNQN